jgi:hypothetical protein
MTPLDRQERIELEKIIGPDARGTFTLCEEVWIAAREYTRSAGPVYEIERDRHGLMYSGPLGVGECVRVLALDSAEGDGDD